MQCECLHLLFTCYDAGPAVDVSWGPVIVSSKRSIEMRMIPIGSLRSSSEAGPEPLAANALLQEARKSSIGVMNPFMIRSFASASLMPV